MRGVRDAEPVRARALELARQHLGDVPLERAAEGDDAVVAEPVHAAPGAPDQARIDQEAEVAGGDRRAHVALEPRRPEVVALLQHVAQEEAVRVVPEEIVMAVAGGAVRHEERRRVVLALPAESAAAERGAHGARAGVERGGRPGCPLGAHGVFR